VDGPNFFTFAVPEPSTAICALLAVGAMGMGRRRAF
jgi:hypothetical protein